MNHASNFDRYVMMAMHVAIIIGIGYRIFRGEQTYRTTRRTEEIVKNGNH